MSEEPRTKLAALTDEDRLAAARAALTQAEPERVGELWHDLADVAGSLEASRRFEWVLLLLEAGEAETARIAAGPLLGTPWEPRARVLLNADEIEPGQSDDEIDVDVGDDVLRLAAPDTDAVVVEQFLRWFGGRRDLHARQWYDERRRRHGYRLVEEPLTPEVARGHLAGRFTIGQYLLFVDGSCSFGVIDLDLSASALAELRASCGEDVRPTASAPLREYALRIFETARRLGLPLFAEDSGNRGLHLWLFVEPRRPARAVRALLGQLLTAAGSQPPDVGVELFPKQDRPGPKGLSSLVKLPLGIHQTTLRRCPLLDEGLEPIEDPIDSLRRLRSAPTEMVDDVLGRRVVVLPSPSLVAEQPLPELPAVTSGRDLAEALRSIEPGKAEAAACEAMLAGCAVLRRIVRLAYDERRLEPGWARAVVYTLGLVGAACALADDLFATAGASRKELDRARVGLPSPAGCRSLRRLGLASPAECPCAEQEGAQPYPSPALFAVGVRPPAPPTWTPFGPYLEGVADEAGGLATEIVDRLCRIDARLERLERLEQSEPSERCERSERTSEPKSEG